MVVGPRYGQEHNSREINVRLDELRASALNIYTELTSVREEVSAEEVKHRLLGMASEQMTLLAYFRQFLDNFEKRVGVNRTAKTLGAYKNVCRHVERFLQSRYKVADLPFSALDRSFIDKLDLYFRTEFRLAPGTIINLTTMFKTVVNEAMADGIITCNPFSSAISLIP